PLREAALQFTQGFSIGHSLEGGGDALAPGSPMRSLSVEGLDLGDQLVGIDRLDDVVARALAHAPDLVGLLVLARAHDHRHIGEARVTRDRARELKAVLAG